MGKLLCSIMELTLLLILLALESMEARLVIMNESPLQEEVRELQEALAGLLALETSVKEVLEALVLEALEVELVEVLLQEVDPQDILALSNHMP